MADHNNGYSALSIMEWKGAVGAKLDILISNEKTLFRAIDDIKQRLTHIEAKAATYGAIGGTVAGAMAMLALKAITKQE